MRNKIIKIVGTIALATSINSLCHAVAPGFYMGVMVGQTNINQKGRNVYTSTVPPVVFTQPSSSTGFGGRVFMGGNISQYLAVEGGFTYFAPATYKPTVSALCGNPQVREEAVDFVGKAILNFCGLNLFAKGGIAAVSTSLSGSFNPPPSPSNPCGNNSKASISVRPVVGVGVGYDLDQNWVTDVSWTRILKGSNVQNLDLYALGISYHFVDKYCGQFLC